MSIQPHTLVTKVYRGDVIWYTDLDNTVKRCIILGIQGTQLRVRYASTRKLGWLEFQPNQEYWLSLRQVSP